MFRTHRLRKAVARLSLIGTVMLGAGSLAGLVLVGRHMDTLPTDPQPPAVTPPIETQESIFPVPSTKPNVEALRRRYPFISVAERLAYENDREKSSKTAPLPADSAKRLSEVENSVAGTRSFHPRAESLRLLHSSEVDSFINRPGFGMERMPRPGPYYLEMPAAPPIPFAAATDIGNDVGKPVQLQLTAKATPAGLSAQLPGVPNLYAFHHAGQMNFVNVIGLGYVKDRDHVAGFVGHQFTSAPEYSEESRINPPQEKTAPKERWLLRRLELMSVWKYDQPAVYVLDHLPRMDEIKNATTRPLNEFEQQALKTLQKGEDLATDATVNRIHLLGSLRAGKQCLECHQVERGDLLGAFSYELQRDPPVRGSN